MTELENKPWKTLEVFLIFRNFPGLSIKKQEQVFISQFFGHLYRKSILLVERIGDDKRV